VDAGLDSLAPGQTIGPYQILSQIGQGGMATVYKAYHPAMDRYVALKVLPRQLAASREFTGRFEHEARLIAKLEHAHILPVHDYGAADGYSFLAMRYVEAGTLKDRLQAGPLTPDEIDRYFTQLADALDYAHAVGVIHRDLKPSNVLIDKRGNLFLTDFGIAKLLEGSPAFTTTGAMIGTPAYMSPEQAQGLRVDLRTDIYSLGVVLYEMVTGRVPFEADTPLAVILKHVSEPLPLPTSVKPDVPPAVERVLLKALAKQRDDRFATTADFIAAWQAARPALRAMAEPPAAGQRTFVATAPTAPPAPTPTPLPTAASAASASEAASRTPLPQAPPPPARPRGRLALLGGLAGAAVLGFVGLVACGALALVWLNGQNPGGSTPEPTGQPTAVIVGDGAWQSWVAANTNWVTAMTGDGQLITGGPGGVAGWDMAAGEPEDQLTSAGGLPSPFVTALLADADTERLWIATDAGLASTDGQDLVVYGEDEGLDSSVVQALARTSGGLLAGTAYGGHDGTGLNLLTGDGWQPVPGFPSLDAYDDEHLSTYVTAILEDGDGDLWVGTDNGLGHYDGDAWTRYAGDEGLPGVYITALALVDGDVWAGTENGPARFDGEGFRVVPDLEGWWVHGILPTSTGEVWVSLGGGLARWTGSGSNWRFYEPNLLPSYDIYRGVEGPDGTLYFGTDDGVLRVAGDERSVWRAPNVPAVAAFASVRAEPQLGQLWFAEEYGDRIDVFDLASETWQPGFRLDCDYCVPLARDAEGRLWAGGDLGVWIFDADGNLAAHLTTDQGLPDDAAYGVAFAPTGEVYLATLGGVAVYDGAAVTAVYDADSAGLNSDEAHGVWVTSDGALWVAAGYGISRLDLSGEWTHYGTGDPFEYEPWINDLAEDANGAVWLATDGEGVYRLAEGAWTKFSPSDTGAGLPSTNVKSITLAPDGTLWFGLYYSGAAHFDGTTWVSFQVEDGLIHSNVNDIYVDDQGRVWFATSGGVSRYSP